MQQQWNQTATSGDTEDVMHQVLSMGCTSQCSRNSITAYPNVLCLL